MEVSVVSLRSSSLFLLYMIPGSYIYIYRYIYVFVPYTRGHV